jgi:hypothetical protein
MIKIIYHPKHIPEINPTQNTQSGKKKNMQENWPILPSRNSDTFWTFVSDISL